MQFPDRFHRLEQITQGLDVVLTFNLLKSIQLKETLYSRIATAVAIYIWESLISFFPNKSFELSNNLLSVYASEIMALPNITPNGLILPKAENILAYNSLHRAVAKAFKDLGFDRHFSACQFPLNVRLISGTPNQALDRRARSATKAHCDVWAGVPAGAIVFMMPVLGDVEKAGVHFFEAKTLPEKYQGQLKDFDEGHLVVDSAIKYDASLKLGELILFDPFLLHQTQKRGVGMRVSLDFRCLAKQELPSDRRRPLDGHRILFATEDWLDYGTGRLVVTSEALREYRGTDHPTVGYEVALKTLQVTDGNDV